MNILYEINVMKIVSKIYNVEKMQDDDGVCSAQAILQESRKMDQGVGVKRRYKIAGE